MQREEKIRMELKLNKSDYAKLQELSESSGVSRTAIIRNMLAGYRLVERPPAEFYQVLNELRGIGHNINQITAKLHSSDILYADKLDAEVKMLNKLVGDIMQQYLTPQKTIANENGR